MRIENLSNKIDTAIRFFLYLLIFWLPYSSAVVESSVITALLLWLIKRLWLWQKNKRAYSLIQALGPPPTPLNSVIFIFLVICFLSALGSAFWEQAFRGLICKTLEWFVIFWLVVEVFDQPKHIFWAIGILLFTAASTAVDAILQFHVWGRDIFFTNPLIEGRATAGFSHPNKLGSFFTLTLPLALVGLFTPGLKRRMRFLMKVLCVLMLWSFILTFSRGAWAATVIGIAFFTGWIRQNLIPRLSVMALILSILVGSLMIVYFSRPHISGQVGQTEIQQTLRWRWTVWKGCWTMIKEKPFLGHGPNTFMPVFQEYRQSIPVSENPTYAHNSFLQMTAEVGILGLAGLFFILGRIFYLGIQVLDRNRSPSVEKTWILAGLCGVLSFLLHNFVDTDFYSLQVSALFWLIVGLVISLDKSLSKTANYGIKNLH